MRLCTTRPTVRRTWTVELRALPGGPVLVCQECPRSGRALNSSSARSELLAHLARHARHELLAPHLRTCQCYERGCSWHPRHRGCSGPIRLVLARDRGGRMWRLADACTACAMATSQAAVVPDTLLSSAPPAPLGRARRRGRRFKKPDQQTRVREMLSYLAAALPSDVGAAARLIALQCILRINDSAQVSLPTGVLRSLRLGSDSAPWRELEQSRWLHADPPLPPRASAVVTAQLLDAGLFIQHPARPDRLRAADWALRAASRAQSGSAPVARLVAVCLASHTEPESRYASSERDRLAHECGLTGAAFTGALDQLTAARFLSSWRLHSTSGDLEWTLTKTLSHGG
ncbi:hypothetical protein C6Y14_28995 [Streptomyces dioscori]|uniref:Uncharacterized protein n=1 Tax=Streptomyces dioscori TaxID=2109333 RepID=A0A2P8Q0Y8_9ACTN|nr:hypothetical protein C6Y14_28995 [Streptomyces dioscori]